MLGELFSSWTLYRDVYMSGLLAAALLAAAGVVVVAREQAFAGAALSEVSMLGVALALWLPDALGLDPTALLRGHAFESVLAIAFAMGTALAVEMGVRRAPQSRDSVFGCVFVAAASLSLLAAARDADALTELYRMLASSSIAARPADTAALSLTLVGATALLASSRRSLLLFVVDEPMAEAVGMRIGAWGLALAGALGLVVGISVTVTGVLYTFGCLLLPAVTARSLCREIGPMFAVAPLVAVATAVAGFLLGHRYDYPLAQTTIAVQALAVLPALLVRRIRHER